MNKEIGKTIKIGQKDFLVVSKLEEQGTNYLYLMSIKKPIEVIIAKAINRNFRVIEVEIIADKSKRDEIHQKFLELIN